MQFLLVSALFISQDKPATLTDLSGNGIELKEAFNKAAGNVRLLLIVSPG
jgi:hypothetical protein